VRLERDDVDRLLDDADQCVVSERVETDPGARFLPRVQVAAFTGKTARAPSLGQRGLQARALLSGRWRMWNESRAP